ncbi:hypothetical protein PAAG_07096 [Paracoccidioides lutzii Pb01]|uniref:Uncharacterized protein n=1 Tax=Paracoccidioides lutzii (strain ATCC MYA-826 / Pb01) TaxID=502779 RepID=C1H8K5_PARBA|nr:hypothetical protein PAAG_07096 [Paracoccidioides lutzii Pb01]EEH36678.2 hypothetical protein PAAG_07096 [Paracoccidioides lutzii Pb01]
MISPRPTPDLPDQPKQQSMVHDLEEQQPTRNQNQNQQDQQQQQEVLQQEEQQEEQQPTQNQNQQDQQEEEQQEEQQEDKRQQYQPYLQQLQHQGSPNLSGPNHEDEYIPGCLPLPYLDTSATSTRLSPKNSSKPVRFYAALQLSTPGSASTSAPPSPSLTSQTPFMGCYAYYRGSSVSLSFPDHYSASTFSTSLPHSSMTGRPASIAAVSTLTLTSMSSEVTFPRPLERISQSQSPTPIKPTKYRTFLSGMSLSSRKKGNMRESMLSQPFGRGSDRDAAVADGAGGQKETRWSRSGLRILGRLVRREKQ